MKSVLAFWFAFSLSIVLGQIKKIIGGHPQDVQKVQEEDLINPLISKYAEYSNKDNVFPATFQASIYGPYDFWRNNERTFFEAYKKSTRLPEFHQIRTSVFERTKPPHSFTSPVTNSPFDKPFSFKPTEYIPPTNYIPPPKPIRASVIKLETVTKYPNFYSPSFYDTTTKYSPPLGNLLSHVLIENSKIYNTQDLSFHYQPNSIERINSTFDISSTVLLKPTQSPLTTLKPSSNFKSINKKKYNETNFTRKIAMHNVIGQSSVQDSSQNFNLADVNFLNLSKTVLNTLKTTLVYQPQTARPDLKYDSFKKNISSTSLKNVNWVISNPERISTATSSIIKISSFDTTKFKPFQRGLKPSNKPKFEAITNFTTEGLSATKKSNAKNLSNNKMKTTPTSTIIFDDFEPHFVNLNDELSLDAKILKDTNWDSLTNSKFTKLVVNQRGTFQIKNKGDEKENITTEKLNETTITEFFDSVKTTTTFIPPTIAEIFENTTIINFPSKMFLKPTKTNINDTFSTIKKTCQTLKRYDTVEQTTPTNPISFDTMKVTTREPLMKPVSEEQVAETTIGSTITTAESIMTTLPRRNYRRKPKVVNFTPYPTPNDFQKKAINRNNFPKRQKPNITLAFGNKISVKSREGYEREDTKFSDDAVGKRKRKLSKRRRLTRVQSPKVVKQVVNTQPI